MVEVVFVIVILGIVAAIGSKIVAKIYESYIYSRGIDRLQTKTELALLQISKYLAYRVKGSTIARKLPPNDTNMTALTMADDDYKIFEWIGYDNEGFEGNSSGPGWSGFVDLASNETNKSQVKTMGSHLSYASEVMESLSFGDVNLSDPNSSVGLIFSGLPNNYNVKEYGWYSNTPSSHNYVYRVQKSSQDILNFIENQPSTVYEHYKLCWTAYALVPEGGNGDWNLSLYYNFRPWMGEKYSDGNSSTLIEHVSTFKFRQTGSTIRLKLCAFDPGGGDFNITFCKEKVVF